MEAFSIPAVFVQGALSGAKRRNVSREAILAAAGISDEVLSNPRARVDAEQYARLIQQAWLLMDDEFMGLAAGRSKPGSFATMSQLAIRSRTIGGVVRRAEQFYALFENSVTMRLETAVEDDAGSGADRDKGLASLTIVNEQPMQDPQHFFQESLLVIWHRFVSWLAGQELTLERIEFDYPMPPHADEYRRIFTVPLVFDQPATRLIFPARQLALPVIRDDAELHGFLATSPADLLARPAESQSHLAQIRSLIGRDLSQPLPDFETVAEHLHLSPQTLRRRLRDEHTSYREIKDELRRDVALYYLARPNYTIDEIACLVGFTEASTFHRAFKKWTGSTPGAYREATLSKKAPQA